jgi:hypothetical protein
MPSLTNSFAGCMALDWNPEKTIECNIIRKPRNKGLTLQR